MSVDAGWYTDPGDGRLVRWWDGTQWTAHTQALVVAPPAPVVPAPPPPPAPTAVAPPPPAPVYPTALVALAAVSVPAVLHDKPKGVFGARKALEEENDALRRALAEIGLTEREQLRSEIARLQVERGQVAATLAAEQTRLRAEIAAWQAQVVAVSDEAILQEVGIYRYRHPLDSGAAYKERLAALQGQISAMAKSNKAVTGAVNWTVNGSTKEGGRMIADFSKLMLRAYNNEADNAVRALKPYALPAAQLRLDKARSTISRLGKTMQIEITDAYHRLRIAELELTADYAAKTAEEKERDREQKARLREEEKARREFEREKERLAKEAAHYTTALLALRARGDEAGAAEVELKLAEIGAAIEGVDQRAANTRAGFVYIISNVGAFGQRMVKVGMTRRLEPQDRVRELGDASVPFRYDTHAMIFSEDAVGLETALHHALADRRVNLVNAHREFFYATPTEVRDLLVRFKHNLLHFDENPEALEWHQSENMRTNALAVPTAV
jgi:hypothetical protein